MCKPCGDMIVNLMHLPALPQLPEGVRIRRAMAADHDRILDFIRQRFSENWVHEADAALSTLPAPCLIAVKDKQILGFCCWDVSALNYFGPIGVDEAARGTGVGSALLIRALEHMRDAGYGYAIIGWVSDAADFYRKTVNALFIPGGEPENTVYANMVLLN
ncbi:MAG: GNAT family N-acetyltransferase [Aristaeellaceae bacterium]